MDRTGSGYDPSDDGMNNMNAPDGITFEKRIDPGAKPDGWPGWKLVDGQWSDAHDAWGHNMWLTDQNSAATGDAEQAARDAERETYDDAVVAEGENRNEATQDIVDRYSAVTMDRGPADQAREAQQQALGMQKSIYDKLMAYDPRAEAAAAGKRATASQLAQARSGGGGAAARQQAQFQALQSAPAIQSEAANAANQQASRNTQLAAQAASQYAETAQGTRGQDIQQAQAEVDTGLNVANGIANAVGRDLQLSSDDAKFLGQMQMALEKADLDWAALDETARANAVDEILRKEGLEQNWKQFKASQDIGALDVLGAVVGTARGAVGTAAAGKTAGLW